jgi:hypothetical protein
MLLAMSGVVDGSILASAGQKKARHHAESFFAAIIALDRDEDSAVSKGGRARKSR